MVHANRFVDISEYRFSMSYYYIELLSNCPYLVFNNRPQAREEIGMIFGIMVSIDESLDKPVLTKQIVSPLDFADPISEE